MAVQDTIEFVPHLFADGKMVTSRNMFALNANEFAKLYNMRYVDDGVEDRKGCSVHNTSVLVGATNEIRSIHQKILDRYSLNRIIVQSEDLKYYYVDSPPTAGSFSQLTSSFSTENPSALKAIFCEVGEHTCVVNGEENFIWSGTQPRPAAIYKYINSATAYLSYLDQIYDSDTTRVMSVGGLTSSDYLYFGFWRPFSGLYFDFNTNLNDNAATWDVEYYNGGWTDVSGDSDGTDVSGDTFKQDGLYSWTLPSDWVPFLVQGGAWYFIRMKPSGTLSATVELINVYVQSPIQPITNLWDQNWQPVVACYHYDQSVDEYKDYLPDVVDGIKQTYMKLDTFTGGADADGIYIGTEYKPIAFRFKVDPEYTNSGNAEVDVIEGWDGDSWDAGTGIVDTTKGATSDQASFNQNGVISWNVGSISHERAIIPGTGYDLPIYWTRLEIDADAVDTDVRIWDISYIPNPESPSGAQSCIEFKNRLGLIGLKDYPNEMWISGPYNPQDFNGLEFTKLIFGDGRKLTDGIKFYNEAVIYKEDETWLVQGFRRTGTGAFGRMLLDPKIGAFRKTPQLARLWLDRRDGTTDDYRIVVISQHRTGIYFTDGTKPIKCSGDIDDLFDPDHANYIGDANIAGTDSAFDWARDEYHLIIGSYELVYSTRAKAWSFFNREVNLTSIAYVTGTSGQPLLYGGTGIGKLHRLENDTTDKDASDDDAVITFYVDTRAMWPGQLPHEYENRQLLLVGEGSTSGATITISGAKDGQSLDGGNAVTFEDTISLDNSTDSEAFIKDTIPIGDDLGEAGDTLQIRFKSATADKRARLIAYGLGVRVIRDKIDE